MKIAIFTDTYTPQINGVVVSIETYRKALEAEGHTVYIFAAKVPDFTDTNPHVIRIPSVKLMNTKPEVFIPLIMPHPSMAKIISYNFEIVHAHGNGPFSVLGYEVAKLKQVPYVLTFHTVYTEYTHYIFKGKIVKPHMIAKYLKWSAAVCDVVIAPSEKMKKEMRSYGVKKNIEVLSNFVDTQAFVPTKDRFLRSRLSLGDQPIVLSVGRLEKEKDFDFLLRAFQLIEKSMPDAQLVLVGDGSEQSKLKAYATELGIAHNVHFFGRVDASDMPNVYADATVFAFPSTTETQGLCVLEAVVSGLPVVVVKDLAYVNMVANNDNGFVVDKKESIFAEKIVTLLQNPALREKFSDQGKKRYREYFNEKQLVAQLLSLFHGAITKQNAHPPVAKRLFSFFSSRKRKKLN